MPANLGTESVTVQNPVVKYAGEIGWEVVSQATALTLRRGESGLLFYPLLEQKLLEFNPGIVTPENVQEVIRKIESARNSIEGNSEVLAWLRGERTVYVPSEKRARNVTLVRFDDPKPNVFQVTAEWQFTNGLKTNRADVMFLINGVPVALVETKSAKKQEAMEEALVQIRRYHRETPEMLTTPQVFDISHIIEFFYSVTWFREKKDIFNWKDEVGGSFERKVKAFFDRQRFLTMLKEWILFYIKDDELQKSILRQHQTRAVEKVLGRCEDAQKKTGLVWHTQGSGKTFTMITAARLLLEMKERFAKATVLLVIDRNELEGQLMGWVERLLGELESHDIRIEHANSKARLRELLAADFRGLIVTMVHKFDGMPKNLCTRENVFVLIDEAHRSTGGDLGNHLMAALPNATLIGFTGTPIDLTAYGKGTFKIFGAEDDHGYLDKYSIAESIKDKTTLKLKYLHAPNEICLPAELLEEEFLNLAEAEGVTDIEDLNKVLDKAVKLKAFLKNEERVQGVAKFVADHFQTNVLPLGYKAFLVGVDREACALYKQALDELLSPEWVVPIYTEAQNDSEKLPLVAKYQVAADTEKQARKIFPKRDVGPKIFIVTDKLLTGFDAPILYCMYLDKPMRDHVLLQAIARVNRPYEEEERDVKKPCGLVVDFVGILSRLKKALAFEAKDVSEISEVVESLDVLLVSFRELMAGSAKNYLALTQGKIDDKAVERAIDAFTDKQKREDFFTFFKELQTLYEILSPSKELADYIQDYRQLATLYEIVRNAFAKQTAFLSDLAKKTENLIRENASYTGLTRTTKEFEINERSLATIQQSDASDNNKVINLIKAIQSTVARKGASTPHLLSIAERADAIQEDFKDHQLSTRDALEKLEQLAREQIEADDEKKRSGLNDTTFSLYWELKREGVSNPKELAVLLEAVFTRFPNFAVNPEELRQLKAELYKILLTVRQGAMMVALSDKLLKARGR